MVPVGNAVKENYFKANLVSEGGTDQIWHSESGEWSLLLVQNPRRAASSPARRSWSQHQPFPDKAKENPYKSLHLLGTSWWLFLLQTVHSGPRYRGEMTLQAFPIGLSTRRLLHRPLPGDCPPSQLTELLNSTALNSTHQQFEYLSSESSFPQKWAMDDWTQK